MFRYSSSSSVPQSKAASPSPSTPGLAPPTDPLPAQGSRPHDILINRCHEVKRITKSIAAYFEGLATAHHSHSLALSALSGPKVIQTPLAEQSLFIPATHATTSAGKSTNGVTPVGGAAGWHDLLVQTKETNKMVAEEHASVAKLMTKEVVVPLKKLRSDMKSHIAAMEKDLGKLTDAAQKERDIASDALTRLAASLASVSLQSGPISQATAPDPLRDPVLLRSGADTQLKSQVAKENELLQAVIAWTDKTEQKEKDIWREVGRCWTIWEQANTSMLLSNQQRSIMLSADVEAVAPDTEWSHFTKLNHTIPADTPPKRVEDLDYPGRDDPLTTPLKEGLLDRQKRIMKTWSPGFYILTPSGHLHSYASSSVPISTPATSLNLRLCTLGPMPTPDNSSSKQPEALFTIEGPDGTKHVLRAKSWEELSGWWGVIEQFTKVAPVTEVPTTTAVGDMDEEEEDPEDALARERAQAEREMFEADQERQRELQQDDETAGDIGSQLEETPKRAVPPPPLPARSPAPPSPPQAPAEADIGFSPTDTPTSPPILTELNSPDAPPRGSSELERVKSIEEGGGDLGAASGGEGKKEGEGQ